MGSNTLDKAKSPALAALLSSAVLLPAYQSAEADAPPESTEIGFRYGKYQEDTVAGSDTLSGQKSERYDIDVAQFSLIAPVGDSWSVGLTGQWESMSGASPWFSLYGADGQQKVIMSGASIEDRRAEYGVEARYFHDEGNVGFNYVNSEEDDYHSDSVGADASLNSADGLRTYTLALSASVDKITPTQGVAPTNTLKADKDIHSIWVGVSQIINDRSIFNLGLGYTQRQGYLTDPYKYRDNRPDNREEFVLSGGYRHFFDDQNGALQTDYRYFIDSWDVESHTLELAWVQNLNNDIQVTPFVRGYNQSQANFYSDVAVDTGGYYSDDHRLSSYSAVSFGLRLKKNFGPWRVSATAERYESAEGRWRYSQVPNKALVDFWGYSLGFTYNF